VKYTALVAVALSAAITVPSVAHAQAARRTTTHSEAAVSAVPGRAIRRDIPLTDMIQRAFAAGTRDSTGRPGKNYWLIWPDYTINARFDAPTSRITGTETIVVHNNGPETMNTIQMRLDQNLFAANVPRAEQVTDITDGMKLTKLAVDGDAIDLNAPPQGRGRGGFGAAAGPPAETTISGADLTSATIRLHNPVAPHGTVTLQVEWNFQVPLVVPPTRGIRMGRWGDSLYQVGQWYPRVAVFDDLREGGWDTDPYLGPSEFYNNLGHFDVHLDMPAGWIVGATGILQNPDDVLTPTERQRLAEALQTDSIVTVVGADQRGPGQSTAAGDRLMWHFVADSVADVAWGTSDRFVWQATHAVIPGTGKVVPINVMFEPSHARQYAIAGPTVRHALQFYSQLWMPYTFPDMTVVDGPELGMEYPMFIMSSAGASDHETGHQWWPMMVNTNETWYGFMDEGFNQYMNILSNADTMGGFHRGGRGGGGGRGAGAFCTGATGSALTACEAAAQPGGRLVLGADASAADSARVTTLVDSLRTAGVTVRFAAAFGRGGRGGPPPTRYSTMSPPGGTALLNGQGEAFGRVSGNERLAPLMWDANYGGPEYSEQAYSRAPQMLSMLGGVVGDSAVWKAMSGYAKAWKFRHPSPWDYAFYMDNALHQDLGWFWYYWLFTTESVDGSIQGVATAGARTVVTVRQDGAMPSPVVLAVEFSAKGPAIRQMSNSRMLDDHTALVTYPVSVWFNGSKKFKASLDFGGRHIAKITLDPFGRFPDRDVADNVWPRDSAAVSGRGARRGGGGQ
jgi:hypothetical protein